MRTVPVHRSLYRRILVLGGERDLVQGAAVVALLVALGGQTVLSLTAALFWWFLALYCLQRMGKRDTYMSQVFSRHVKQQDFYPARSTAWRER